MSRRSVLRPRVRLSERVRRLAFRTFLMLFSWIWVLQMFIPLRAIWRDESSWGVRIVVTALTAVFIAAYSYLVFRIYFYRRSWSLVYTAGERWALRVIIGGIGVALVFWQGNDWALTLIFAVITIDITAPPRQAFAAMIPAMIGVAVILLLAPVTTTMMVSVLAISLVLGILTAAQMLQGDEMGELVEARYTEARIAAADERLRIARDLHDVLGHTLSLITLKSELARRLVAVDPARAQQEMHEVEAIARAAMSEVRHTVAGERQPVLAAEIDAARQLLDAAGIALHLDGEVDSFSGEIESMFVWGIREGITNVVRHSRARHCTIRLGHEAQSAVLVITDDGPDERTPGAGTGLPGLRERLDSLGGSLVFEILPVHAGHRLCLSAPVTAGQEAG